MCTFSDQAFMDSPIVFRAVYIPIVVFHYRHMNLKTLLAARRKKLQDSRKLQQYLRDVHEVSTVCVHVIYSKICIPV